MIKWLVRIGCAIGVVLIVLTGGLLLAGGGRRLAHTETVVYFNHPAAQLWPWLVEVPRLKQWLGGFIDSIPEDSGGLRVGARSKELVELDGRRWEIGSQVTALQPGQRLALHLVADEFEDDTEYLLEERGGVTMLTYKSDAHYRPLLARLLSPLISRDVERKVRSDLAKLDGLLAREPATLVTPPKPGSQPAFAGCCAAEPTAPGAP
jgi:uncharacterized protein YndB with AHSA1/START domain